MYQMQYTLFAGRLAYVCEVVPAPRIYESTNYTRVRTDKFVRAIRSFSRF